MSMLDSYCKAYPVAMFRQFEGWIENTSNVRKDKKIMDGQEVEIVRNLTDEDILYLQKNYSVTDSIFQNEHVIFNQDSPQWRAFCTTALDFHIPGYQTSA